MRQYDSTTVRQYDSTTVRVYIIYIKIKKKIQNIQYIQKLRNKILKVLNMLICYEYFEKSKNRNVRMYFGVVGVFCIIN